jgi:hypothetical protein
LPQLLRDALPCIPLLLRTNPFMERLKVCLFCDRRIPGHMAVCSVHSGWYKQYKNELWFKELRAAQDKQHHIEAQESSLDAYLSANSTKTEPILHKIIAQSGTNRLTTEMKARIDSLRKNGMGYRKIARVIELNENTIKSYLARKGKVCV